MPERHEVDNVGMLYLCQSLQDLHQHLLQDTVKLAKFKNPNTSDVFLGGENLIHLSAHSHFSSGEYKGGLPQYTCVCCMVQRYAVGITTLLS